MSDVCISDTRVPPGATPIVMVGLGEEGIMGITASLLLTAAGAVLTWGVNASVSGLNIHTIGVILMIVGIVGFVVSLFFWSSWGGFGTYGGRDTTVIRERDTIDRRV